MHNLAGNLTKPYIFRCLQGRNPTKPDNFAGVEVRHLYKQQVFCVRGEARTPTNARFFRDALSRDLTKPDVFSFFENPKRSSVVFGIQRAAARTNLIKPCILKLLPSRG